MGSSWQHNTVSGLNGFAHAKFLRWLFGKEIRYLWSKEEGTFIFYFDAALIPDGIKEGLRESYSNEFRIKIKKVD